MRYKYASTKERLLSQCKIRFQIHQAYQPYLTHLDTFKSLCSKKTSTSHQFIGEFHKFAALPKAHHIEELLNHY